MHPSLLQPHMRHLLLCTLAATTYLLGWFPTRRKRSISQNATNGVATFARYRSGASGWQCRCPCRSLTICRVCSRPHHRSCSTNDFCRQEPRLWLLVALQQL
ncbi:hypothetical protein LXA43DRAFT_296317 [Ganoderma leucocontextum]|nr:hypothetical protein LXA43DRAFT_296317 [Ganoderma leucocontextum]